MATPQAFKIIAFMIGFTLFFVLWPVAKLVGRLFVRALVFLLQLPFVFLVWLLAGLDYIIFPARAKQLKQIAEEIRIIKMQDEMKLLDKIIADPSKLINSEYGDMSPQEYARLMNDQEFKKKEDLLWIEKRKGVIHAVYK